MRQEVINMDDQEMIRNQALIDQFKKDDVIILVILGISALAGLLMTAVIIALNP